MWFASPRVPRTASPTVFKVLTLSFRRVGKDLRPALLTVLPVRLTRFPLALRNVTPLVLLISVGFQTAALAVIKEMPDIARGFAAVDPSTESAEILQW
jgi:hypothetical protein